MVIGGGLGGSVQGLMQSSIQKLTRWSWGFQTFSCLFSFLSFFLFHLCQASLRSPYSLRLLPPQHPSPQRLPPPPPLLTHDLRQPPPSSPAAHQAPRAGLSAAGVKQRARLRTRRLPPPPPLWRPSPPTRCPRPASSPTSAPCLSTEGRIPAARIPACTAGPASTRVESSAASVLLGEEAPCVKRVSWLSSCFSFIFSSRSWC